MSVVLKNVLLLETIANTAVATYSIKAFFALSRNTKSPISKKEKGWRKHNAHLFCV